MARNTYAPANNDSLDALVEKAFNCGRDMHPDDPRANWIDFHKERRALIAAYHEGQAEQYENEDW